MRTPCRSRDRRRKANASASRGRAAGAERAISLRASSTTWRRAVYGGRPLATEQVRACAASSPAPRCRGGGAPDDEASRDDARSLARNGAGRDALVALVALLCNRPSGARSRCPPRCAAKRRRDRFYAAKQLVETLGATVTTRRDLGACRRRGATLSSAREGWNMTPRREAELERWVEAGGQLVVDCSAGRAGRDAALGADAERHRARARRARGAGERGGLKRQSRRRPESQVSPRSPSFVEPQRGSSRPTGQHRCDVDCGTPMRVSGARRADAG